MGVRINDPDVAANVTSHVVRPIGVRRVTALTRGTRSVIDTHNRPPASGLRRTTPATAAIRIAIVALALGTAYIHSTLGGTLFTLNAMGYVAWAAAILVPLSIARRYRPLILLGLGGYAAATILAWAVEPTFYAAAYEAKAIEVAIVVMVAVDFARRGGVDRIRRALTSLGGRPHGPAAGRA
jgi:hypothetical protein